MNKKITLILFYSSFILHPSSFEKLLQRVQAALELLAAGGIRQPGVPLGPERRARDEVDVGLLQGAAAEFGRVVDLHPAERPPEVGRHVEEGVERAARHRTTDARGRG